MVKRYGFVVAAALSVVSLGAQAPAKKAAETAEARAARIHKQAIVVDTHIDTTMMLGKEGWDFMVRHQPEPGENHVDLPRIREGGLDAAFFSIYMPGTVTGPEAVKRALVLIDHVRTLAEQHPNEIVLATTAAEVRAAHKAGKFAALMGMEGGHMIDDSLAVLRDYQRLGVRYLTLSHSVNTNWADSSGDKPAHNGLTTFGKDVVRELNRLGVMVDISHVADKTFWDALEVSRAPIFASHSSCRALTRHARNMTDEMIVALAKKGGVVQVNFYCGFISQKFRDNDAADTKSLDARMAQETAGKNLSEPDRQILSEKLRKELNLSRATLADVVAHIDHIRKIAGIDAIGLGADFDGVSCTPIGLDDVSKYPNLTRALLEKGYSAEDIRKIYGGNFLRVMRAVEAAAGK